MAEGRQASRIVCFEKFELNLTEGELRKNGIRIRLQDQPFQVLAALLERPGKLVAREALRQKLWSGDTFVDFDRSLNTAIAKIREALGDAANEPRFIETLPRRGYRFIGAVERLDEAGEIVGLPAGSVAERTVSHYQLLEKLGEGGMGVVYKAEDTKLRRNVALKFLAPHLTRDPKARERFLREAQAAAAVDHPNICTVYEIDEAGGQVFIAMAYVEGQSLEKKTEAAPLEVSEAVDIAMQAAQGLQAAHEGGVVHRDIKSANLMLTPQGQVKIMDFGLAQLLNRSWLTQTGTSLGTPACMSPEQAQRQPTDHRTDVWSLGAVIYEMVAGRLPFEGEREEAGLHAIVHEDAKPITALRVGVPIDLDRLVGKAMAKSPDERYQHADEMLVDLRALEEQLSGAVERRAAPTPAPTPRRTSRISRIVPWALLGAAVAMILAMWLGLPEQAPPTGPIRFSITPGTAVRDAVISPNRRHIAYVAGDESLKVWVQDLDKEEPRELPGTEGVVINDAISPGPLFWSPESDFIGFATARELRRVSVGGGAPISLCPLPGQAYRGGAWRPGGKTIVFGEGSPPSLYEVPSAGGKSKLLLKGDKDLSVVGPYFVPRGPQEPLLMFENQSDPKEIVLLNTSTGKHRTLEIGGELLEAVYSPKGYVLARSSRPALTEGLWAWPVSADSLVPEGDPFLVAKGGARPSLAGNGTLVYLDRASRPWQLVWRDRGGEKVGVIGQPQPRIYWTKLSPDGRRLAGIALENQNHDIWLHEVDRPVKTRFTFEEGWGCCPVWSSKGDRITFVARTGTDWQMFWKSADGSGVATRMDSLGPWAYPVQWSSDQEYLLVLRLQSNQFDIGYLKRNGDKSGYDEFPLVNGPFHETAPVLSPDGRFVAYASNESGQYEVYVQRFPDGGGRIKVSQEGGGQPVWSRDGRELFYVEGDWLVVVPVTWSPKPSFGPRRRLFRSVTFRDHGAKEVCAYYDVSLDGKRFTIPEPVEGAAPPTIRVVQNWFEEFRGREQD